MIKTSITGSRTPAFRITIIPVSLFCLSLITFISGCDNSDPAPSNENELITTVTLSFEMTEQNGVAVQSEPILFSWRDADGSGSGAPVVDDVVLEANATYELLLTILDESKTPSEDIGEEILEEDEEHQFFFTLTGVDAVVQYDDMDGNGNPVGMKNLLETTAAGTGLLNIILRHEPDKDASGVSAGDPANAGGETDVEVSFPVTVQ